MPSGQTHDRITLWTLPLVTGISLGVTRSSDLTLIVSSGFLFSGLMLSPDLDLYSRPFKRWGWLRWIWIPYQKVMRHRSLFSHGLIIGTTLRVLYLAVWIIGLGVLGLAVVQVFREVRWNWQEFGQDAERSILQYQAQWLALFVGLELGAMSHTLSDQLGSGYKRFKRQGWQGILRKKRSRRTTRKSSQPAVKKRTPKTKKDKG
ncbi:MAG: metal-binding protein [Kastovskya adunca ATA6-11-RM4]|nr:metal-binding protein [Kastovskya adunca ATA6-11-RM4]